MEDYTVSANSERKKDQTWEREFPAIEPFEEILEEIAGRGIIEEDQHHGYNSRKQGEIALPETNIFIRYDNTEVENQTSLAGKQNTGYKPEQQSKVV